MADLSDYDWKTSSVITRHPDNPVLSKEDVPYRTSLVFNAGVCKFRGEYVMIFRNDVFSEEEDKKKRRGEGTFLGIATSADGVSWTVKPGRLITDPDHLMYRAYDPRLTVLEGRVYLCFALDQNGIRGGVAVSDDLENWEVLNLSVPDNRNMVIFPERVGGEIVRLERPFAAWYMMPPERFEVWLSTSPDGRYWGNSSTVLRYGQVPWSNNKLGPAAPPVKTDRGWLAFFHSVDKDDSRTGWGWREDWTKRYTAGLMLLDLEDPSKLIGLSKGPVLTPETEHETKGYRDQVIFPGGMILEPDGEVKIYYGAADTVECLATANVDDLLGLCKPVDAV